MEHHPGIAQVVVQLVAVVIEPAGRAIVEVGERTQPAGSVERNSTVTTYASSCTLGSAMWQNRQEEDGTHEEGLREIG